MSPIANPIICTSILLMALNFSTSAQAQGFENRAAEFGLSHTVMDDNQAPFGGGISFIDIDNNGFDDLIITNGENQNLTVYLNEDGSTFTQANLGLQESFNADSEMTAWADYDNDGDLDLYVTYALGRNRLYMNDGNLNFVDVSEASGLNINTDHSSAAVWADFDNDGFLDLFVSTFLQSSDGARNLLFRNLGDGSFEEIAESAGVAESRLAFTAVAFDYDGDSLQDIYITNDKDLGNQLFKNLGNLRFQDVSRESGAGIMIAGMGIAIGDYDNDGDFDVYAANEPPSNVLLRNDGDGSFTDVTDTQNVENGSLCWGGLFFDYDLDSWLDLHVSVSGFDYEGTGEQTNGFYLNKNGSPFVNSFVEASGVGIDDFQARSWGSAYADFDNDGHMDVAVYNNDNNFALWHNQLNSPNNWVKLDLEGTISNRDGIGAVVKVYANEVVQTRYKQASTGYKSQSSSTLTLGLGRSQAIDSVLVNWPSGTKDKWVGLGLNQQHLLTEESTPTSSTQEIPDQKELVDIYPNPFISHIRFDNISTDGSQEILIFNILGQLVFKEKLPNAGNFVWDGRDQAGSILPKGAYLAVFKKQHITESFKILKQ